MGGGVARGKARQQDQAGQFVVRQRLVGADQTAFHRCAANCGQVQPGAVVLTTDENVVALALEAKLDAPDRRLAQALALGGGFNPVVHRVAQHVHQRIHHVVQDVAVHQRAGAAHRQLRLLVHQSAGLPHAALQARRYRLDRHHAGAQDRFLVVAVQAALIHQQGVQRRQILLNGATQFAGVRSRFHQAMGDGVEFVVLLQFQRIEIAALHGFGQRRRYIADINQLLQFSSQLLEQAVLPHDRPGLGDGFANPLLDLTGEDDALAHQPQYIVHQMSGNAQGRFGRGNRGLWRGWLWFGRFDRFRLGVRCRRRFVIGRYPCPVNPVRPIQHRLQHGQRLRRRRADAEQRLAHGFQTISRIQEGFGQRPVGQRLMLGERLQNVLDMVGQRSDAAHADGIASAFQGVGDTPRHIHILKLAAARRQSLDGSGEFGGLMRQFLQQTVQQFLIDIGGQRQRYIFGLRLTGSGFRFSLLGDQRWCDQQINERRCIRRCQWLRPAHIL